MFVCGTLFVRHRTASGRKGSEDDNYYSTCALHLKDKDRRGTAHVVRDGRDPEMPMASADKATTQTHIARPEVGTCNYEFEYEGQIDRCGLPAYVSRRCRTSRMASAYRWE